MDAVTVTLGVNPVPVTVTDTPLGPWTGLKLMIGVVIVNEAVAKSDPPSDPVALTMYAVSDAVPVIVTWQLKLPVAETVCPQVPMLAPVPMVVSTV
jgi:hypothetical protein